MEPAKRSKRSLSLRTRARLCTRGGRAQVALYAAAAVITLLAVLRPFFAATYPPMTDLPFHAAQTSIFAHYGDPSYHFREQFELTPLAVPYVSSYLLGAVLMLFLPAVAAVKTATAIMLLMVPAGLAVLAWGLRKSPLLGLAGVPFVFCNLTHWGFINFVSSLGIFAATLGLGVRVLDRPSLRSRIALGVSLFALLFTHVFRFPYALAGLLAAAALFYPATKRVRPLLLPMVPALLAFAAFLAVRPAAVGSKLKLGLDTTRLHGFFNLIVGSFLDEDEPRVAKQHLVIVGLVLGATIASRIARARGRGPREILGEDVRFAAAGHALVTGCVLACVLGYVVLPMEIGVWWYVYPREATAALYLAMALLPDLPKAIWLRALSVGALAWSALSVSRVVVRNYEAFDRTTQDFTAVVESIPKAPKLLYLVFDHGGSTRATTPYIHLPAYVQAEKGGFLSFHFAMWGASPVKYREGEGAVVPPAVPLRWEWQPNLFDVRRHGPFFDWFLVRSTRDPGVLFRPDKSIRLVRHEGTWWLYARGVPD